MRNECVAGVGGAARREEGEYPLWDIRPTSNTAAATKIRQPDGLFPGERLAALLLSQRAPRLSSFVAPLQAARQKTAHSFLILKQALRIKALEKM